MFKNLLRYFKSYKTKGFFTKLFLGCVIITILPLLLSSFFSTNTYKEMFLKYSKRLTTEKALYSTEHVLGEKLTGIYSSVSLAVNDNDTIKYSQDTSASSIFLTPNIIRHLQVAQASNNLIESVFIYFVRHDTVIDEGGKREADTYLKNMFPDTALNSKDTWLSFLETNKKRYVALPGEHESELLFTFAIPMQSADPDAYVVVNIRNAEVLRLLDAGTNQQDSYNYIFDANGALALSSREYDEETQEHIAVIAGLLQTAPVAADSFPQNFKGQSQLVTYAPISSTGWYFVSVDELADYKNIVDSIGTFTALLCCVLILFAFIASLFLSISSYKPIMTIMDYIEKNIDAGESVSGSELKQIEQSLENCVQLNNELSEYQLFSREYIVERFYYWLANGIISSQSDYEQCSNELNIDFHFRYYTVLAIKINDSPKFEQLRQSSSASINHIQMYMKSVLTKLAKSQSEICAFYDDVILGIIMGHSVLFSVHDLIVQFQQQIKRELDITFSTGVSGTKNSWSAVNEAYSEARDILSFTFDEPWQILEYDKQQMETDIPVYFPYDEENIIIGLTTAGNTEKLEKIINTVFRTNVENGSATYADIIFIANQFLNIAMRAVFEKGYTLADIYDKQVNLYRDVAVCKRIDDVKNYLIEQYRLISERLSQLLCNSDSMSKRIMDYIRQNYAKEISITTMADEFGFSAQYFSKHFKELTGGGFVDTLNSYRIKKAGELMAENHSLQLSEVSQMVGYNSYKSFSRNFKKYTGLSPIDFKNRRVYHDKEQ